MSRLLPDEYVKSRSVDDGLNDCTATSPVETDQQEEIPQQEQFIPKANTDAHNSIIFPNYQETDESNVHKTNAQKQIQQIHLISSSDEDEFLIGQNTIQEGSGNMSSEESGDFEGFDDFTTPNSSCLINDTSQEDLHISSNSLKRRSHSDFNKQNVECHDELETVEKDYNDEEIVINKGGKTVYRTRKITQVKSKTCENHPYTPNKRKKDENEESCNAYSPTELKTPPDQIVEVNSDSTTNSLKQKRQQINSKFQLNLCQQQNYKTNNNPNKCSTESTSEFPVSSPSNPQQPRGGKYPARPPLLKNTLPADSFERQLAMITVSNPQMTLAEKIQSWDCEEELSELEDVKKFDEDFKRIEKQKKLEMKQKEKCGRIKNAELKSYDFITFRQMILNNIKEQKNRKHGINCQSGVGTGGVTSGKCAHSSGSESSTSIVHVDDRPSTSAVAQHQLQQRRSKPQPYFEAGEPKKRTVKIIPKRNQNSTTPPQTSSSDNEKDCFKKSNNNTVQRPIHVHDKLICASSSEEAISQEVSAQVQLKAHSKVELKNVRKKSPVQTQRTPPQAKTNEKVKSTKNCRVITDEEVESFFRPHRLNRERDKPSQVFINDAEDQSASIIQMRLDFSNENRTDRLMENKKELFKTPIIPQKYLENSLMAAECQKQNSFSSRKNEEIEASSCKKNSVTENVIDTFCQEKTEIKTTVNDLDGVYHQQHEFCNYLGLTGMSTATAMANAVAELAQCNLARRSMRVFRQQQQERRDKSAKEERLLKALKSKQLKEIRKVEKEGCDIIPVIETEQTTVSKCDEGLHSQASEPTNSLKDPEDKDFNNSVRKSSNKSQTSFTIANKKPEIKILYHIAAKNEEEAEILPSECIKETKKPIRGKSIRQGKQRKSEKLTTNQKNDEVSMKGLKKSENEKTAITEEIYLKEKENNTRVLRSPALLTGNSTFRNTRIKSQSISETKEVVQSKENTLICKIKSSAVDNDSVAKSVDTKCASPFLKSELSDKEDNFNENSKLNEISLINTDSKLMSSKPNIIQKKIQMALEASRKSKPSIFIVQSLQSEKDNNLNIGCVMSQKNEDAAAPQEIFENKEINKEIKRYPKPISAKYNKNGKRKVFKGNKVKKYPISKRKLRKRKIIVIKTLKPKLKTYESFNEIKRELRSSPRFNENKRENSLVKKTHKTPDNYEAKSYRTVHTETKDLETYIHPHNNTAKRRLMAKASAILERSRRMTLRNNCSLVNNKTNFVPKIQNSKLNFHGTKNLILKSKLDNTTCDSMNKRKTSKISRIPSLRHRTPKQLLKADNLPTLNCLENENVVVSSTTNTFDERLSHESLATQSPNTIRNLNNTASYVIASSAIKTKDQQTQCNFTTCVHYLNTTPLAIQSMRNPLKTENGAVLYIYHELDILIVIQERLVSFWKSSKLINLLITPSNLVTCSQQSEQQQETFFKQNEIENRSYNNFSQSASSSTVIKPNDSFEWIQLGELDRLNYGFEISAPYANRICLHNSTPIYLEMRAQQLPKNQRDCNLLSMYINIYFYHDDEMIAKCNSIQLDSIQSDIKSVNYTTLVDSRYFIITWQQENLLGKTRSGLCKYSLTPQLDTLASIREFKSMRHTIRYLECMNDDKLIGFGETQVSIWDYRSGDVLMNFDLEIPMGKNLGSIYFPSHDIEQNNMIILYQFRCLEYNSQPELMIIACTATHTQPSYKILQENNLPLPAFKVIKSAIKTSDHLVITGKDEDEIWISLTNPRLMTVIPNIQDTKRYYSRDRSQLIELTAKTLNVNSLTNYMLQLAAGTALN